MFKYEQNVKAGPVYITKDSRYIGTLYTTQYGQPCVPHFEFAMGVEMQVDDIIELANFLKQVVQEIS